MIRGFLLLCPAGAGMLLAVQPGQLRLGGAQGCTASHRPRSALSARGSVPLRALLPHPVPCEAVRPPPAPHLAFALRPAPPSQSALLFPAQSPAAPVDPLQQAYAGMQHYTGEEPRPPDGRGSGGQRLGCRAPRPASHLLALPDSSYGPYR